MNAVPRAGAIWHRIIVSENCHALPPPSRGIDHQRNKVGLRIVIFPMEPSSASRCLPEMPLATYEIARRVGEWQSDVDKGIPATNEFANLVVRCCV